MVKIYLNPANEMIYSSQQEPQSSTTAENIEAAKELISELKVKGVDTSVIECEALVASKEKSQLE